jgi:hypothetical protein
MQVSISLSLFLLSWILWKVLSHVTSSQFHQKLST